MTTEDESASAIDPTSRMAFVDAMQNEPDLSSSSDRQKAEVKIRFAKNVRIGMRVQMSPAGLLAVGGMVSSILLASALLVGTSVASARLIPKKPTSADR